jgi:hypothetical protein
MSKFIILNQFTWAIPRNMTYVIWGEGDVCNFIDKLIKYYSNRIMSFLNYVDIDHGTIL